MAERWQQWMPFHIDRFRGSQEVQAMHPAARSGFLYLLASAWQTDDCTISSDPIDLATESGLGDELWATYGARILRKFLPIGDRFQNSVQLVEWDDARRVFEARQANAKRTHSKRSSHDEHEHSKSTAPCNADTQTLTGTVTSTGTEQNQVPLASTADAVPAARGKLVCTLPLNTGPDHEVFDDSVQQWQALYPAVDVRQELRNMKGWLVGSPKYQKTKSGINRFINSWLSRSQNEAKPTGGSNGAYKGKSGYSVDAAKAAIEEIENSYALDGSWGEETGEAGQRGLPDICG